MAGRPSIEIEPHIEKLVAALLVGATYQLAAQYAGISYFTLLRWRKRAVTAKPGTPLARLRDRLEEAEARAAVGWLAKIEKAATDGNWQAAAWKLERRYPDAYGPQAKVALKVEIQTMAARVAAEMGVTVDEVLAEAQGLLQEGPRGYLPA